MRSRGAAPQQQQQRGNSRGATATAATAESSGLMKQLPTSKIGGHKEEENE
jgi:hypothetical protein